MLAALWAVVLIPTQAMAAYNVLVCDSTGGVMPNTEFFHSDRNDSASLCAPANAQRIFSTVLCNFVVILNDVLGKVYCGMQFTLQRYVAMLISIYIAIFGVQILMATTQLTSKEILLRLIKIGAVWAFVSSSTWAVNLLFQFFIDFANQGIVLTLTAVRNSSGQNIETLAGMAGYAGSSHAIPAYVYIDKILYDAISGPFTQANSKLIGFFATLSFMIPPLFLIAAYWLLTTFTILARTLISFMMCLSAIAFLITLSPIFFCFMLFQATYNFFETWIKYMISYALQVLVVFACVAMWLIAMANFVSFFDQLSRVVFIVGDKPSDSDSVARIINIAKHSDTIVGVCPYIINPDATPLTAPFGPQVACANSTFDPDPVTNPSGYEVDRGNLIRLSNIAPAQQAGNAQTDPNPEYGNELAPNATQHRLNSLAYYVLYHMITLIIITYTFDTLLKSAPKLAKELAGPQYVPMLGQGFGGLGYGGTGLRGARLQQRQSGRSFFGSGDRVTTTAVGNAVGQFLRQSSQLPRSNPGGGK